MRCEIFVKDERGRTISVYVDSEEELKNMTVREFKRRARPDLPYEECRLLYIGKQLEDDRTLGDYGVCSGSTFHKVQRLRGGGGPPPDEDKGVPRTVSMDKLANMRQEESSGWCRIM